MPQENPFLEQQHGNKRPHQPQKTVVEISLADIYVFEVGGGLVYATSAQGTYRQDHDVEELTANPPVNEVQTLEEGLAYQIIATNTATNQGVNVTLKFLDRLANGSFYFAYK